MDIPKPEQYEIEPKTKIPWQEAMQIGSVNSLSLPGTDILPRAKVMGDWCFQGDLGFLFAPRGVGKTWLGMYIAHCLATGKDCGPWAVADPLNVLYLDGEMPPASIKSRDRALGEPTANLTYLNHEILFERTSRVMNLADHEFQEAVIDFCKLCHFDALFLDNLSTLASGIDENKSIDWEKILPWLLRLRREHILVVFIHHAGRGGQMRGHSKREDPSAWIISLLNPKNDPAEETSGAHFLSSFTKWRNAAKKPSTIEWNFTPMPNEEVLVRYESCEPLDVFRSMVQSGINTCAEIAEEMEVTRGRVSQLAKKAVDHGWLEIKKGKYLIRDPGQSYSQSNDP